MEKFVEKGKIIVTNKIAERMKSDNNFYQFVVTSFERCRHGDWGILVKGTLGKTITP